MNGNDATKTHIRKALNAVYKWSQHKIDESICIWATKESKQKCFITIQSVVATGVYKEQGLNQCQVMTHTHWEFLDISDNFCSKFICLPSYTDNGKLVFGLVYNVSGNWEVS